MTVDYTQVTEISGDDVTREQIQRMYTRYHFARQYCTGKDVLELACGCGQGLGYLAKSARRMVGGDYSEPLVSKAHDHYGDRIPLLRLDAQILPFKDRSFDVVVIYEAIYYLRNPESFARECSRVLRRGGVLLICTANKDLPDFNPSPYSHRYFSPPDFLALLRPMGFSVDFFGDCPLEYGSAKQRILSLVKQMLVRFNLMPKTMAGKKLLKRLVFGKLVPLPSELSDRHEPVTMPSVIEPHSPDARHKVIFAVARLHPTGPSIEEASPSAYPAGS